MVQFSADTLLHCYFTALVQFSTDTLLHCYCTALVQFSTDTLLHWYSSLLKLYCTGTLLCWYSTALLLYCIGTVLYWYSTALLSYFTGKVLCCTGTEFAILDCTDIVFHKYWKVQKGIRCGEKRLCPILKYRFGIFLEGLGTSLENFSQSNLLPAHDQIWKLLNTDQECYQLDNSLRVYWVATLLEVCLYNCSHIVTQLTSKLMTKRRLQQGRTKNNMQQYAGIYLLQIYSTCFGCPTRPSSWVHKIVTSVSGTGHSNSATTFFQRGLIRPRWRKIVALLRDMTRTRGCSYSCMYSWLWVRWTSETCRVNLQ